MKLEEFINKYQITLTDKMRKVCADGLARMQRGLDHVHNETHVEDIIGLLDTFFQSSDEVKFEQIDFNILLPAICWHDVWKAKRQPAGNLLKLKFEQYWDGIGSALIFTRYARREKTAKSLAREIRFAILHHGSLLFNLSKSRWQKQPHLEARLVDDLDSLDFWSMKRLKYAESKYLDQDDKFLNPKLIPFINWAYDKFSKKITSFSFQWSKEEYIRRKDAVLKRAKEVIKKNKN